MDGKHNRLHSKLAALDKADLVSVLTTIIYSDPILTSAIINETLPYVTVLTLVHSFIDYSDTSRILAFERLEVLENENSETN